MDVMDAIHRRRSVRDFTGEAIEQAAILRLIDAAVWAPSAVNEQPWQFTVVQDRQKLDTISRHAKAHLLAAPAEAMPSHLHEMLVNPDFQIFYHAPVLIVISAAPGGLWAVEDCGGQERGEFGVSTKFSAWGVSIPIPLGQSAGSDSSVTVFA